MKKNRTLLARDLRKRNTPAEQKFWAIVRNRQVLDTKWSRQKPIVYQTILGESDFFIADFYCAEQKLVVELDGGVHREQVEYDAARTTILEGLGYRVLRLKNEEVDMEGVVRKKLEGLLTP